MMTTDPFESLLRRARRRWVGWRCAESAGIGAALGAGLAVGLVIAGATLGGATMSWDALALPAIGAVLGIALRLRSQPTLAESAGELDRQLDLDDLLTTALLVPPDDPFGAAVRSMARERARTLHPADLLVRRIGNRGWSAIAAVLVALPVIILLRTDTLTLARAERSKGPSVEATGGSGTYRSSATDNAGASDPSRGGSSESSTDSDLDGATASDHQALPGPTGQGDDAGRSGEGIGAIIARQTIGNADPTRAGTNRPAGVAGRGSSSAAPWTGSDWGIVRDEATRVLRDQRVPDETRDVVRRYFNTDD